MSIRCFFGIHKFERFISKSDGGIDRCWRCLMWRYSGKEAT